MSRITAILLFLLLACTPLAADESVDINTADAVELAEALNGVGPAKAEAIVAHRDKFGPFTDVDELRYVKGIGAATIERNRDRLSTGASEAVAER